MRFAVGVGSFFDQVNVGIDDFVVEPLGTAESFEVSRGDWTSSDTSCFMILILMLQKFVKISQRFL